MWKMMMRILPVTVFVYTILGCSQPNIVAPVAPAPFLPRTGKCPGGVSLPNVQLTTSIGESNFPKIAWNGEMFLVAWWDMRSTEPEIFYQGVNAEGVEVLPSNKVQSTGWAKSPSLAFDGVETHLVWWEEPKVMSARLGKGDPSIRTIAEEGAAPAAGAWGSALFVNDGFLYFRSDGMIDLKTGNPVPPQIIEAGGIETPRMAYNGTYYAIVWSESVKNGRRIAMQRVSPRGEKFGAIVPISQSAGLPRNPDIAWTGSKFVAAWTDGTLSTGGENDKYTIHIALIPEVGDAPIFSRRTDFGSASEGVSVATSGEEFAAAWVGSKGATGCGIYFQRFDAGGDPIGGTLDVSDGSALSCSTPSLAWNGNGYGIVWHDDRGQMESEIYYSHIACGDKEIAQPAKPRTKLPSSSPDLPTLKEAF